MPQVLLQNPTKPSQMARHSAWYVLACGFLATLLAASCVSTDPRDGSDFGMKNLANGDSTLGIIALVTEYVPDPFARTFLYTRLAEEYQKRNQVNQSLVVIRRGERLSQSPETASRKYQIQIELAGYYIAYNQYETAHHLLKEALDRVLTIEKEDERGQALESIILLCFKVRDVFNDILRVAIDNVYALYDPELRVMLLSELGQKYQEVDSSNRASVFIQQSLASAAAITNPWARSLAYARIGSRFIHEDDLEKGKTYLDLSAHETDGVDALSLGSNDAQNIMNTLIIMADNKRFTDATAIINLFPQTTQKVNAMLVVIERYIQQNNTLPARLLVQRLLNQLAQDDPDSNSELSLSSLVRLGEIYGNGGQGAEAGRYLQAALTYFSSPLINNISEYRSRLALALAKIKRLDEAISSTNLITDAYIASQTLIQLSDTYNLPDLLIEADYQARQATYLRESAMGAVAVSWWHRNNLAASLKLLAEINDPFTVASVLLEAAARHGDGNTPVLDSESEQSLRELAIRWYEKAIPQSQP